MGLVYDYILMLPFTVALFWVIKILINPSEKFHGKNEFLYFLIALTIIDVVVAQSVNDPNHSSFFYLHFLDCFVAPMAIPIAYFYLRALMVGRRIKWEYLMLLPGILIGVCNAVVTLMMGQEEFAVHYPNVIDHAGCKVSDFLVWLNAFNGFTLFNAVILAMLVIIWVLVFLALQRYRQRIENYYANVDDKNLDLVRNLLYWSIALIAFNIILSLVHRSFLSEHKPIACIFFIVVTIVQSGLCYNAHKIHFSAADLDEAQVPDEDEPDAAGEKELHDDYRQVLKTLTAWIARDDKPYLAEGITLDIVAHDTGLRPRVISTYLNNVMQMNFNTWINTYRIQEAKRLLLAPEKYTTFAVAAQVGMTDAASLSRLFKKQEGVTPTEYRRIHAMEG